MKLLGNRLFLLYFLILDCIFSQNHHRELISCSSSYSCTECANINSWANFNNVWSEFVNTSINPKTLEIQNAIEIVIIQLF